MKKAIAIILLSVISVSVCACGNDDKLSTTVEDTVNDNHSEDTHNTEEDNSMNDQDDKDESDSEEESYMLISIERYSGDELTYEYQTQLLNDDNERISYSHYIDAEERSEVSREKHLDENTVLTEHYNYDTGKLSYARLDKKYVDNNYEWSICVIDGRLSCYTETFWVNDSCEVMLNYTHDYQPDTYSVDKKIKDGGHIFSFYDVDGNIINSSVLENGTPMNNYTRTYYDADGNITEIAKYEMVDDEEGYKVQTILYYKEGEDTPIRREITRLGTKKMAMSNELNIDDKIGNEGENIDFSPYIDKIPVLIGEKRWKSPVDIKVDGEVILNKSERPDNYVAADGETEDDEEQSVETQNEFDGENIVNRNIITAAWKGNDEKNLGKLSKQECQEFQIYYFANFMKNLNPYDSDYGTWSESEIGGYMLSLPEDMFQIYKEALNAQDFTVNPNSYNFTYNPSTKEYEFQFFELLPGYDFRYLLADVNHTEENGEVEVTFNVNCYDEEDEIFKYGEGNVKLVKTNNSELNKCGIYYVLDHVNY